VPAALAFSATTLSGEAFQGASLAGKPVVFWFWAPWCPKCRSEAPAVKAAAAKFGDVAFVGVAGLDTEAAMKEFVQQTGTGDIVHLSDAKGAVWTKLGVSEQSTFVFMKPDGSTEKTSGPLSQDRLDGHVRQLLGQ
jgi:thiol-disulfide isomerase/thioredoxin